MLLPFLSIFLSLSFEICIMAVLSEDLPMLKKCDI